MAGVSLGSNLEVEVEFGLEYEFEFENAIEYEPPLSATLTIQAKSPPFSH